MDLFTHDVRHALRRLRRQPTITPRWLPRWRLALAPTRLFSR